MTSVFSSIVLSGSGRSGSRKPSQENDQDIDVDAAKPVDEEPDLRELNNALRALIDIYPDIQPEVFREMLMVASPDSRLEVVTEQLLKNDAKYIRGRFRRRADAASKTKDGKPQNEKEQTEDGQLRKEEAFRNEKYKAAVMDALYEEFKGLSRSTIRAVLAEHNYHYTPSRRDLIAIVSRSWRFSVTSFLFRRKTPTTKDHPLIYWARSGDEHVNAKNQGVPRLIRTCNAELNQELHNTLIAPVLAKNRDAQTIVDSALAHQIQEQEATQAEEEYDCECCYSTVTIHNLAACNDGGHYLCFRCISLTVNEAIYGQGWTKSIDVETGTVRCIAPVSEGECCGRLPYELVRRAVEEKETGKQTMQRLEDRIASESLLKTRLPLVSCPFCPYAEVDELDLRNRPLKWKLKNPRELTILGAWAMFMLFSLDLMGYILAFIASGFFASYFVSNPFTPFLVRLAHKSRGLRFTCRSPSCGKRSCMRCHTLWRDPHECYSSQLNSLQQALESAMTAAVKRTCPKCNVSFVKSAGCNKLVCVCGYQMCYLCRAEIGKDGYMHFCQHFRVAPGPCTECENCDLYRTEDESAVVEKAKAKAENEWWESEGRGVSKEVVEKSQPLLRKSWWDWRAWEGWLDRVMERCVIVAET